MLRRANKHTARFIIADCEFVRVEPVKQIINVRLYVRDYFKSFSTFIDKYDTMKWPAQEWSLMEHHMLLVKTKIDYYVHMLLEFVLLCMN